jgi:tetratricopeptide (TPR) repeat protein
MSQPTANPHRRLLFLAALLLSASAASGFCQFAVDAAGSAATPPPRSDQADQRIRFWQAQVARDPEYWTNLNALAAAYAQKARETGDISYFELAEATLRKSLAAESTHVEAAPAYTQLATVHLAEHRFREAAEDAAKAIALQPRELMPYPYAGDAQLELGNYAESQAFYDRLADPDDGKPHPGIEFLAASHGAGLDWIKGNIARANDDLERSVGLANQLHMPSENIAWTQFMLGEQYFQAGDLVHAETWEAASLKSFPRYHRALAAMGQIRAAQGRLPEAIDFYKQAIAIIPLPLYAGALGDVYIAAGDRANAEKQFALVEFIGKLSAINQQVYNRELATFYADHDRNLPEALRLARKELEVRHDVYTSDALAWTLLKNHQPAQAKEEMTRALRLGTRDALMEFHAGLIDQALGDRAGAARHLEQALAINPHFHVLFAAQARMALAALEAPSKTPDTTPVTTPSKTPDKTPVTAPIQAQAAGTNVASTRTPNAPPR